MLIHESIGKGPDGRPWGCVHVPRRMIEALPRHTGTMREAANAIVSECTLESIERIEDSPYGVRLFGPVKGCFVD